MSKVYIEVEGVIDAPAQEVYDIIADYENGHPHILPKEHFSDLTVEEGGKGGRHHRSLPQQGGWRGPGLPHAGRGA